MIKFGTSGWRDIIAEKFTFDNVKIVVQAIANHLKEKRLTLKPVVVGYDPRFLSEHFSRTAASVLAANGIPVFLCDRDVPTPAVALEIIQRKAAGGINFTASHNPYTYHGLKFSEAYGGPAVPQVTQTIETYCQSLMEKFVTIKELKFSDGVSKGLIEMIDPKPRYLARIRDFVDTKAIKKAKLTCIVDPLHGAGRGYLDEALRQAGAQVDVIHENRDVTFGGLSPEPNEETLKDLLKLMKSKKSKLGLSVDGDADRFGVVDSDGTVLKPNEVLSLLLHHLVKTRKWKGKVVRSVMTTHFIDAVAKHHGLEVKETPVGFKYIGEAMVQEPETFVMGGEESAGFTMRGHIPEKDGIMACMLVAELAAIERKPLKKVLANLQKEVGAFYSDRMNFHLEPKTVSKLQERLTKNPPLQFGGVSVWRIDETDGFKFLLKDGSWLGMRLSGTEPVVRLYLEAKTEGDLRKLALAGQKVITNGH